MRSSNAAFGRDAKIKAKKNPTSGINPRKNHSAGFFPLRLAIVARTEPMIRPRKSHGKSIAIAEGAGGGGVCVCAIKTATVLTI